MWDKVSASFPKSKFKYDDMSKVFGFHTSLGCLSREAKVLNLLLHPSLKTTKPPTVLNKRPVKGLWTMAQYMPHHYKVHKSFLCSFCFLKNPRGLDLS